MIFAGLSLIICGVVVLAWYGAKRGVFLGGRKAAAAFLSDRAVSRGANDATLVEFSVEGHRFQSAYYGSKVASAGARVDIVYDPADPSGTVYDADMIGLFRLGWAYGVGGIVLGILVLALGRLDLNPLFGGPAAVAGTLFVAVGGLFLLGAFVTTVRHGRVASLGAHTTGTIVAAEALNESIDALANTANGGTCIYTIEFEAPDGSKVRFQDSAVVLNYASAAKRIGGSVRVTYDPRDPKRAFMRGGHDSLIAVVMGAALIVLGLFVRGLNLHW